MESAQSASKRSRLRRILPILLAALLVGDMIAAVGVAFYQTGASGPEDAATYPAPHARAMPGRPQSGGLTGKTAPDAAGEAPSHHAGRDARGKDEPRRRGAVRDLLAQRAKAVRAGNLEAFLATVARDNPALRAKQRQLFRNLSRLPLAAWRYEIAPKPTPAPPRPGRSSVNVWTPRLLLHYQFAGFDQGTVTATRYLTFTYGPRGWRVTDRAKGTARRIWDFGPLRVTRKGRALVLGAGTSMSRLRDIARRMNEAVPVISGVWGRDWSRRVVVLVPSTQEQAGALSPDGGSLNQITAVATVASGPGRVPPPGTGDRVIVNPANFADLSPLGRGVVLRHELTHVATRAHTDKTVPMWLVEGFADYIGYRGVDLPPRSIARELGASVRVGEPPRQLPGRKDFSGTAKHLTRAYESAWLAAKLVAQRHGEHRLVRLYRQMGSARHGSARSNSVRQVRARVMRDVLGTTPPRFRASWRAYVQRTLG